MAAPFAPLSECAAILSPTDQPTVSPDTDQPTVSPDDADIEQEEVVEEEEQQEEEPTIQPTVPHDDAEEDDEQAMKPNFTGLYAAILRAAADCLSSDEL